MFKYTRRICSMYDMVHRRYDIDAIVGISRLLIPIWALYALQYFQVHHLNDGCILSLMTHRSLVYWAPEQYIEAQMNVVQYCIVPATMITVSI